MKTLWAVLVVLVISMLDGQSEELLNDSFKEPRVDLWESFPKGAEFVEGSLKLSTRTGQACVVSLQEFENCEMTIRFSVSEIGRGDSIFYYFGFQTVQPWMREAFTVMIQDSALVIGTSKNGTNAESFTVGNLSIQAERDYELVLRREAGSLEVLLDGVSVFHLDDAEKIPTGPLFGFFAVNSFKEDGEPVVLNMKSLVIDSL